MITRCQNDNVYVSAWAGGNNDGSLEMAIWIMPMSRMSALALMIVEMVVLLALPFLNLVCIR